MPSHATGHSTPASKSHSTLASALISSRAAVHDPAQHLVEVLGRDERLRQIVEDRETVLLVGQTAVREHVLDRRRQLGEIALTLDQIVGDAELERLDGRVLVAFPGDHHDRDAEALGLQLLEHLDPRQIRHPVVEQQHVVVNGLQLGERIPGAGDRLDARPPIVLLEGAQRQRDVLRMVLGVEHTDRRVPALGRGAEPAVRALEHDRQGGQILRTLHQIVGGTGLEQAHRGVGVARAGHEYHRHLEVRAT